MSDSYDIKFKDGRELKKMPLDMSAMPKSALPEEIAHNFIRMTGVRFAQGGRVYDFIADELVLSNNTPVITDVPEKGLQLGWVAKPPIRIDNSKLNLNLNKIVRIANDDDIQQYKRKLAREEVSLEEVAKLINKHRLDMHLINVEYTLDLRKLIIYFSAENRVDFRNLLRDLIAQMKARVELRQIGARDETKMLGGIGPCGEELCCSRYINRFKPVNIRMAKIQNLSLKPTKVSGNCGRLKCCLAYENDAYENAYKKAPKLGSKCSKCDSGKCGIVKAVDVLNQYVTVEFDDGTIEILKASDIVSNSSAENNFHPNETMLGSYDDTNDEELKKLED